MRLVGNNVAGQQQLRETTHKFWGDKDKLIAMPCKRAPDLTWHGWACKKKGLKDTHWCVLNA